MSRRFSRQKRLNAIEIRVIRFYLHDKVFDVEVDAETGAMVRVEEGTDIVQRRFDRALFITTIIFFLIIVRHFVNDKRDIDSRCRYLHSRNFNFSVNQAALLEMFNDDAPRFS